MKSILSFAARLCLALAACYLALVPVHGVVHQGTLAAIGLGLIGLGLCLRARKKELENGR